jgi:hypothetical protein
MNWSRENTRLLYTYSELDPRVRILGYMVKLFAKERNSLDTTVNHINMENICVTTGTIPLLDWVNSLKNNSFRPFNTKFVFSESVKLVAQNLTTKFGQLETWGTDDAVELCKEMGWNRNWQTRHTCSSCGSNPLHFIARN